MATTTPNLGLTKPEVADRVNVSDLNENADLLDAIIGKLSDLNTAQKDSLVEAINEAAQGGMSVAAKNLLLTILRAAFYSSDQTSNIDALEVVLASSGSTGGGGSIGGDTGGGDDNTNGGDETTNTIIAIENDAYAVQRNTVLCIIPGGDADVVADGDTLSIGGGVLVHNQTGTLMIY